MDKKIVILAVALIMCMGLFVGCSNKTATDSVAVTIKVEYREKFNAESIAVSDLNWDNAESIIYGAWSEVTSTGRITVYLKKHGKKHVRQAIEHFNSLDFVEKAEQIVYSVQPLYINN